MRVSSSAAVRSNAGYERTVGRTLEPRGRECSSATSSGCDGNSGQTSRTRSHSVITMSKRWDTNSSRCLVRFALMSMPRLFMTRTALGCSGFGWLPALAASIAPADMWSRSASAIWERALFPVHRNRTRRRRPERRGRGAARATPARARGRDGARRPPPAAARDSARGRSRSSVSRPIGRAAPRRHEPAVAELTQVVRHQALRLVDELRQLPHRPVALRPAPAAAATAPGATRDARTPADHRPPDGEAPLGCMSASIPVRPSSDKTRLMHSGADHGSSHWMLRPRRSCRSHRHRSDSRRVRGARR